MVGQADRSKVAAGLWLMLTLAFVAVVSGSSVDAGTITILPLGDSITYGYSNPVAIPGGYRSVLYQDMTAAGYNVQLVGSTTANSNPALPAAAAGQEGHIGYQIDGQGGVASFSANTYINTWLAPSNGINPNLILLQLGTNEILGNYHVPGAPYELAAFITELTHLRPDAKILVSTISPLVGATFESEVAQFNKSLSGPDGVIAQLQRIGENVVLVNAGGSLSESDLSSDGIHPTQAGYTKLGHAWFQAVEENLPTVAPEPSTFALFGLGLAGCAVRTLRKSRVKASQA